MHASNLIFFTFSLQLLLAAASLGAQSLYDSIPLHAYPFSQEIREKMASGQEYVSRIAEQFSYIGRYDEALRVPNDPDWEWGFDTMSANQRAYFERFHPVDAVGYLLEKAASEQILILNEAHHKPQHRIFTRQLLRGLYEQGYRYFGLEAVNNNPFDTTGLLLDTALQRRGYPLNSPITGTYVREPQMGLLIREAIETGFTIFAYERHRRGDRELIQAGNIHHRILKENPEARILIHCGWYHLLEQENEGWKWMATHLKEMTGIDPLTVYQDILTERYAMKESPYYRMIDEENPVVFVDETGQAFNGPPGFGKFDVLLYHPRTRYVYNRPDWLLSIPENRLFHPDREQIRVGYPCQILAYKQSEPDEAVPMDVIELEHPADPTALVLPPGDYRLLIRDITGAEQILAVTIEK